MSVTEELLRRVQDDEKYKSIIGAVDEDVARNIELVVRTFITELAGSLPETTISDDVSSVTDDG